VWCVSIANTAGRAFWPRIRLLRKCMFDAGVSCAISPTYVFWYTRMPEGSAWIFSGPYTPL